MATTPENPLTAHARELRRGGWSLRLIAAETGVPATTVRRWTRDVVAAAPARQRPYRRHDALEARPLPPSEDLAYLIGVTCGDGCLWQAPRTCRLLISCDARYPDLVTGYAALIERVLGRRPSIYPKKATALEISFYNKDLPLILGLRVGAKSDDYPIPEWIFGSRAFVGPFVRGLIETDGGIYHEYRNGGWCSRCLFTAHYASIMDGFLRGTEMLGYRFRRVGVQARLTVSKEVHRLALELDLTKERVYIQKGQLAKPRKSHSDALKGHGV